MQFSVYHKAERTAKQSIAMGLTDNVKNKQTNKTTLKQDNTVLCVCFKVYQVILCKKVFDLIIIWHNTPQHWKLEMNLSVFWIYVHSLL